MFTVLKAYHDDSSYMDDNPSIIFDLLLCNFWKSKQETLTKNFCSKDSPIYKWLFLLFFQGYHNGGSDINYDSEVPNPPQDNNQVAAWYDTDL